jgi:hypothetical protein
MPTCQWSRIPLLLLAAASLLSPARAAADSSYMIGNSLTWDMYVVGLQQIAGRFGVSLTPGYHIRSSMSLVYMLNNPSDVTLNSPAIWPTALPSQPWNFVTFEPYPEGPSTLQTDITAAQTFIGLTPKTSNPAPAFYIYEAWPDQNSFAGDFAAYWNQTIPDSLSQNTRLARQYFDVLFERLTTQYGDTAVIRVIPVGDVFARINQLIVSGQFQGASNITDFYRDPIHMGSAGRFVAAITVFATLYGRNPGGAPFAAYQQFNDGNVTLSPEVAAELETIVWDVVTSNSARTGVNPLNVSPGSLSFQSTSVGSSNGPQTVVISNVASAPMALDTISTTENYSQTTTCGKSLPGNTQCTIEVTFVPTAAGTLSGTLTIGSAGVPRTVPLSGSAPVSAQMSATLTTATVGQPVTLTWSSTPGSTCQAQGDGTNSPWSGSVPSTGTRTFTESTAGSVSYLLLCSARAVSDTSVAVPLIWSWPPVDVTFSAMPATVAAGQTLSLNWSSSNTTGCSASGGGLQDGWPGSKPTSGTQSVTESFTPTTNQGTLTFTLSCSSSTSGLSKTASVAVVEDASQKSGGSGAMDAASLLAGGLLCCCRALRRGAATTPGGASGRRRGWE